MGKVGLDLPEVISERHEGAMVGMLEEDVELCAVELESVDLAVLKFEHADDRFGCEESRAGASEPVICAKWTVGLEPVLERARGDLYMRSVSHDALGVCQRVAEVERGDCVEDDFERIGFIFIGSAGGEVI